MNPYVLIVGMALLVGAYAAGRLDGRRMEQGAGAAAEKAAQKAGEAASAAAVLAIQGIEVKNVHIRQQAETVVREKLVYRDCVHDPDGLRLVNEAIIGPEPAGTVLPEPRPAE